MLKWGMPMLDLNAIYSIGIFIFDLNIINAYMMNANAGFECNVFKRNIFLRFNA